MMFSINSLVVLNYAYREVYGLYVLTQLYKC